VSFTVACAHPSVSVAISACSSPVAAAAGAGCKASATAWLDFGGGSTAALTGFSAANARIQIKHSTVAPALMAPLKFSVEPQCGQVSWVHCMT
jgi:hypothetical protein